MTAKKRTKKKAEAKPKTAPQASEVDLDPIVTQAAEKWDKAYSESLKQGDKPLGRGPLVALGACPLARCLVASAPKPK